MNRKVPMLHGHARSGHCRWCGEPILHERGPKAGTPMLPRSWHPECVTTYKLHAWPAVQTAFVRKRDGDRCAVCGDSAQKWNRGRTMYVWAPKPEDRTSVCEIDRVSALELDHRTPLWSIQDRPTTERVWFYGPENLQLLCPLHHAEKTRREAGERAVRRKQPSTKQAEALACPA